MSWEPISEAVPAWVQRWILALCRWDDDGEWIDTAIWCDQKDVWAGVAEGSGSWVEV